MYKNENRKMWLVIEGAQEERGAVRRLRDYPISFNPMHREYGYRFQTECEPVIWHAEQLPEHDPMLELEGGVSDVFDQN